MTSATSTDSLWRRIWFTRWRDVVRGRLDARLDWRQLVATSGLPVELAEAVTQVVGKSRLWRSEKAAIANELVAHFQDGLHAGQSPEQLLAAFGNTNDAAQLIRRAKRRNRPLSWQVWHYGWISLATLLVAYIVVSLWMATGRPTVRVDYAKEVNKLAAAVPENERAWPLYREAFLEMRKDYKVAGAPAAFSPEAKPGDAHWKQNEKFLIDHADSIDELRQATSREHLGFVSSASKADFTEQDRELFDMPLSPEELNAEKKKTLDDRWLISMFVPNLHYLRDAGQMLAADARRAALAGDGETAYVDVVSILGVSRHAQELPMLIGVAVGDAIKRFALATVRDIISAKPSIWTESQLRDLAHELAASPIDWVHGFDGERASFYDSMQRIYTDNGSGDGRLALHVTKDQNLFQLLASVNQGDGGPGDSLLNNHPGLAMLTLPAANFVVASRKDMTEAYDGVTNEALARIAEPYWKQRDKPSLAEFKPEEDGPIGRFKYLFVRMLTPAHEKLLRRKAASESELDGVLIGLALEAFHRKHNKWPASLAELSPQYLPQLPVDLVTGQPLTYKVVEDRPVVYGVGFDADDDSGRAVPAANGITMPWDTTPETPDVDGDWVIWSTAAHN
jgi:hypothetical protein